MYYGQFIIHEDKYWRGRKNIPSNWLDVKTLKLSINSAIANKITSAHTNLFLRNDKTNPTKLTGDFILDFDGDFEKLEEVKREITPLVKDLEKNQVPFVLMYSGHRGFKIAIPQKVFGLEDSLQLPFIYKKVAANIKETYKLKTLDLAIYNTMHTNRITNTKHEKTGLFQTPITPILFLNSSSEEIKEYAKTQHFLTLTTEIEENTFIKKFIPEKMPEKRNTSLLHIKITSIPLCIQAMLETRTKEGERNNTAIRITTFLYMTGKTENEVKNILLKWNENNDPPMTEREIIYIARYMQNKHYNFSCSDHILRNFCPFAKKSQCNFYIRKRNLSSFYSTYKVSKPWNDGES